MDKISYLMHFPDDALEKSREPLNDEENFGVLNNSYKADDEYDEILGWNTLLPDEYKRSF